VQGSATLTAKAAHSLRYTRLVTRLADKVENALNETRMLVLGAQVLLGFGFQAVFQPAFDRLPASLHTLKLIDLGLMLVALGLLLAPTAYHQIVEGGNDTERVAGFAGRIASMALLPFALGLGLDTFLAASTIVGQSVALAIGVGASAFALSCWYVVEWFWRGRGRDRQTGGRKESRSMEQGTDLANKIKQVLTEARVVLPGAQALLGFQLAAVLTEAFQTLSKPAQYIHLASLALMAVTIVLLMAPAAFHRIVEQGEDTERMHRFSSAMVLAALVPLACGVAGDFYIVADKVLQARELAIGLAAASLVCFFSLWFGLTLFVRHRSTNGRTAVEVRRARAA
jgi:hypothetical protein